MNDQWYKGEEKQTTSSANAIGQAGRPAGAEITFWRSEIADYTLSKRVKKLYPCVNMKDKNKVN